MLEASAVICTHNPRPDFLARVLEALQRQTLSPDKWELLIIDNASDVPVAGTCHIPAHPQARHIVERELGIAMARRRGIRETTADLIVFVDDDNVLDKNYLSEAVRIKQEWPLLGVWGSGCIKGDYEVEPPEYLEPYLASLAIREATAARWSNVIAGLETLPWGAGLCVRREVADAYNGLDEKSPIQITGRRGAFLLGGEDKEISHVCVARELGIGVFPALKLTHLIPKHRVSANYLVRLAEASALTDLLLNYKWQRAQVKLPNNLEMLLRRLRTILLYRGLDRRIQLAQLRGLAKGLRFIKTAL
jgi:glycosyltransferase involved in cell wall biosynthesis